MKHYYYVAEYYLKNNSSQITTKYVSTFTGEYFNFNIIIDKIKKSIKRDGGILISSPFIIFFKEITEAEIKNFQETDWEI